MYFGIKCIISETIASSNLTVEEWGVKLMGMHTNNMNIKVFPSVLLAPGWKITTNFEANPTNSGCGRWDHLP